MSMVVERKRRAVTQQERVDGLVELINMINGSISRTFGRDGTNLPQISFHDRRKTLTRNSGKVTVADLELPAFDKFPYCRVNFFDDGTCDITPAKSPQYKERIEWDRCANWREGIDHATLHLTHRLYQAFPDGRSTNVESHIRGQVHKFK